MLVKLRPSDAASFFALVDSNRDYLSQLGDPTSAKFPDVKSVSDFIETSKDENFGIWPDDTELAGYINLRPHSQTIARMGFWVGEKFAGRGLATAAVAELIQHAWVSGYTSIFTGIHAKNKACQLVMFRNGWRIDYETHWKKGTMYEVSIEKAWQHRKEQWPRF